MTFDFQVLVVGAGPVGLASAIELGRRGVRVLLVESNVRGGLAPRAKTTNVRSRTHFRRWGIADRLAEAAPFGVTYPNDVFFVTKLAGHQLVHFKDAFNGSPVKSPLYPEHAQWIPQYTVEKVLLEHLRTFPNVEVRFGTSFVAASQDSQGVTSTLRAEDDDEFTVSSTFLVGADGARSTVRAGIGSVLEGRYGLSRNYNIIFRAPGLAEAHRHGKGIMYWQTSAEGGSLLGPMDSDDIWFYMPTELKPGQRFTPEEAAARIARDTGFDLPYEILSSDEWSASEFLADSYRSGRIFLAGDACHLHPSFGGFGMNMGIADGVDLGWKIAAVLQGWGGAVLLDSYELERRPMARAVIDEALANHAVLGGRLWREGLNDESPEGAALRQETSAYIEERKAREFYSLGIVLGLGYTNSPVIQDGAEATGSRNRRGYEPCSAPGSLAPHAWLLDGKSLYDLFGDGFTLLASARADPFELGRASDEAAMLGVPLKIVAPENEAINDLYPCELTLIRPDQYIAWRGRRWSPGVLTLASGLTARNRLDWGLRPPRL